MRSAVRLWRASHYTGFRLAATAVAQPEDRPRQPVDPKYVAAVLLAGGAIGVGYYYR